MKIVVYSMAHRGDVFPFVPIASELVRRGHDVTFVVPRDFHPVLAAEPFVSRTRSTVVLSALVRRPDVPPGPASDA